jgi:aspartate/methionine/tyrosine aminotransferase
MEALSRFVIQHDLMIVVDQAFERTVFDNREFISMATLPGMKDRTVTVCSISKSMGLSGFRVGYIHACEEIMRAMYGGAVNILGATNTAAQYGAVAALNNNGFIEDYNRIYDERRKLAFRLLNEIRGVRCQLPESGFMAWVNVSALGTGREVARFLAEDAKVRVSPGDQYGSTGQGEGYLRIVLGVLKNQANFEAALERITTSLGRLSKQKGL